MFKELKGQPLMLDREQMIQNAEVEEMKKELRDRAETLLQSLEKDLTIEKAGAILRIAGLILSEKVNKKAISDIL